MAALDRSSSKARTAFCRACKDEFLSYNVAGRPVCPRCGRPAYTPVRLALRRLIMVAIAVALALGAFAYYWLRLR